MSSSSNKNKTATMLFDGDCNFCKGWIERWDKISGGKVHYASYQSECKNYPQITMQQCKTAVQLILPNGNFYSGAHAIFKLFSLIGKNHWALWIYEHSKIAAWFSELTYNWISQHR